MISQDVKNKYSTMKIIRISENGLNLIKQFEGFMARPYLCPAGIPTIGYGTTIYPNGIKVTMKDKPITIAQATDYLRHDVSFFEKKVDSFCRDDINQNQFDALVSFCYNLGADALKRSTLLRLVNTNPKDKKIRAAFMMWVNVNGKPHAGIKKRREIEANLFFS